MVEERRYGICMTCMRKRPLTRAGLLASHRQVRQRSAKGGYTTSYLDGPPPKCGGSGQKPYIPEGR